MGARPAPGSGVGTVGPMQSQGTSPNPKPSPMIYVRRGTDGRDRVGEILGRTPDRELRVRFGSREEVGSPRDLRQRGIESVQQGGLRHRFADDPDGFSARWRNDAISAVCELVADAPGALRVSSMRADAESCELIDARDGTTWDELLAKLATDDRIVVTTIGESEHFAPRTTTEPGARPSGEHARSDDGDRDPVEAYLAGGSTEALGRATEVLKGLEPGAATEVVMRAFRVCLSSDESFTPVAISRLKRLAAASGGLAQALFTPVAHLAAESLVSSRRTDRRDLADAVLTVLGSWLDEDAAKARVEATAEDLLALLRLPAPSKAWTPRGGRVATISALAGTGGFDEKLTDPQIWRGVRWESLVKMLELGPTGELLASPKLRESVLRPAVADRMATKDPAARRLADLTTAPAPLQELVTADQVSTLLLVMSRQSAQVDDALRMREGAAVANSEPRIRADLMAELGVDLAAARAELQAQTERVASLEAELRRVSEELETTTRQLREEADRPRREAALAGERMAAQARQAQIDVFRALADLLVALAPAAETDASVSTLRSTHERRATAIGLVAFATPGEIVDFDPTRHESVDEPTTTVRIRHCGYQLSGDPPTIVAKAVVEAP